MEYRNENHLLLGHYREVVYIHNRVNRRGHKRGLQRTLIQPMTPSKRMLSHGSLNQAVELIGYTIDLFREIPLACKYAS